MTVKELVAALAEYPPELEVRVADYAEHSNYTWPIESLVRTRMTPAGQVPRYKKDRKAGMTEIILF